MDLCPALAAIAFVILTLTFLLLPEGHQPDHAVSLRPDRFWPASWAIFKEAQFLTYTLWPEPSPLPDSLPLLPDPRPILFMDGFHLGAGKAFGAVFAVLVMGFIGGNQVNIFLLRKFTSQQIFLAALLMQVLTGMLFFAGMRGHVIGLRATLLLFFIFLSCIASTPIRMRRRWGSRVSRFDRGPEPRRFWAFCRWVRVR